MTTTENPVDQLGVGIKDGLFDADLDRLERAITARRRAIAETRRATGAAGVTPESFRDAPIGAPFRIKLSAPIGPNYLLGLRGTVKAHRQKKIVFAFDAGPIGRFRSGEVVIDLRYLETY